VDEEGAVLGHFLRNSSIATSGSAASSTGLKFQHFRIVPILFPEGMEYHFDGLAGVVKVTGNGTHISWVLKAFQSSTFDDWEECIYLGTGTAKRAAEGSGGSGEGEKSREICFQNPGVNLLPIKGQLWLTIDTVAWGRIDPETLETVPHAHVGVASAVLNAHPACDDAVDECFVEHPCGLSPVADSVCVSRLDPSDDDDEEEEEKEAVNEGGGGHETTTTTKAPPPLLRATRFSSADLGEKRLIQHSHSPCITPNFVVAKIDSFAPRVPSPDRSGMLSVLHQKETPTLLVMDRRTNESSLLELTGGFGDDDTTPTSLINNHFWNCYETSDGASVVFETVGVTENYLDTYFSGSLSAPAVDWMSIFHPPLRCALKLDDSGGVPSQQKRQQQQQQGGGGAAVQCDELGQGLFHKRPFDYPTFNPRFKMNPAYRFFYAIAPKNATASRWFDSLIKVDVSGDRDTIAAEWAAPNVYLTEASFLPLDDAGGATAQEDDGVLLSVLYNATSDASAFAIFNASTLALLESIPLGGVLPFHAHGIVCPGGGEKCFTNP
jgi:hypothetical protein